MSETNDQNDENDQNNAEKKPDKTDWHRLWALMTAPLFQRLGAEPTVEIDLSAKIQRLDMAVVTSGPASLRYDELEPIYYEGFENLNFHNLISFKSFNEVFNMTSMEEFYGHFTNYRKMKNIKEKDKGTVNLYAVTYHFPRDLFSRFSGTGLIRRVSERVYDFNVMTPVRFVITRKSDHPIFGLFSDDPEQITTSRNKLEEDEWLLREISSYLEKLYKFYGLEGIDMPYTQEMFIKDHYPEWYAKIMAAEAQGEARGEARGKAKGRLIGQILLAQRILKQTTYSEEELEGKDMEELETLCSEIESRVVTLH